MVCGCKPLMCPQMHLQKQRYGGSLPPQLDGKEYRRGLYIDHTTCGGVQALVHILIPGCLRDTDLMGFLHHPFLFSHHCLISDNVFRPEIVCTHTIVDSIPTLLCDHRHQRLPCCETSVFSAGAEKHNTDETLSQQFSALVHQPFQQRYLSRNG
jgi:hypothetical protein